MKILFTIFCSILSIHCLSQVVLLDKASALIRENRPRNAIHLLEIAKNNVATSGDARTYYLLGFAYKDLFDAATNDPSGNRHNFRDSALLSFSRCRELDISQNYQQSISESKNYILGKIYNDAATFYNAGEFQRAVHEFAFFIRYSVVRDRKWLDAHYYKALAFQQANAYDSAGANFEFLLKRDYDEQNLFADLSGLYVNQGKDSLALEVINKGILKYPANYELQINQMNTLFKLGKLKILEGIADRYLKNDSLNLDVLFLLATVCEKRSTHDTEESYFHKLKSIYKRALRIDSTSYEANFNLGVLYYNKAVEIVNNTDVETEFTLLTKILNQSTSLFESALPYLLKAYDGGHKNIDLLHALQAVYYNLNRKEELAEINNLIRIASQ